MQRTDFYQAFARNTETAVSVGNSGVVLSSSDGARWKRTVLSGQPSFLAVDTCPDQRFIAPTMLETLGKSKVPIALFQFINLRKSTMCYLL